MTDNRSTFPRSGRFAIAALLLALISVLTTVAIAAPPSKEDVREAKAKIDRIEDRLAEIRDQLARTEIELHEKANEVERHRGALEEIQADLSRTRSDLEAAEVRYARVVERLNDRAVEAYMQGPATGIDFVLGAETVAELTDRLAYADALAQADAELAVDVANLRNELTTLQAQLEADQREQAKQLAAAEEDEAEVLALLDRIESLNVEQRGLLDDARRELRKAEIDLEEWQEQQAAPPPGVGSIGGSIPEPFNRVLETCPVDIPRGFGDGFGAPRFGGGYHLHKGVDIVAPLGTRIFAPFDGTAYTSSNGLGGNVVFVVGRYGTVYNAHLSAYHPTNSNGPVSTGDIIGYVGSTGYSSVPHDHFEFHPAVMPGGWIESAYGYEVIEDALNPYPLLVQACF